MTDKLPISSPSRPSTMACCCIDRDRPEMHSYLIGVPSHNEVDSMEDPTSLVTRPITKPGQRSQCNMKHRHRPNPPNSLPMLALRRLQSDLASSAVTRGLQTAGVTQVGPTANRARHDSDVNSLLFHLRFNLRSPNLLTITIDPAMNSQVADGMQQPLLKSLNSATPVIPRPYVDKDKSA
ncbi:hypothetical protein FPRO04_07508 [Fusarium proliferatum]|nr:hypothetical protein FPRO03_13139 [Fusarium proliferatum]KAG4277211.1 hypothetical protein FPRO04_07508 [Fusarium proliferatum]